MFASAASTPAATAGRGSTVPLEARHRGASGQEPGFWMTRTRSPLPHPPTATALGHVFADGPRGGRGPALCINSAPRSLHPAGLTSSAKATGSTRQVRGPQNTTPGAIIMTTEKGHPRLRCFLGRACRKTRPKASGVITTRADTPAAKCRTRPTGTHPGHAEAIEITFDPDQDILRDMRSSYSRFRPVTAEPEGQDIGYITGRHSSTSTTSRRRSAGGHDSRVICFRSCGREGGSPGNGGRPVLGGRV